MLIQELHDATRETLSNFFRIMLKSPLSANTLLRCLRVLRGVATNYRIQTERPRASANICHFGKNHANYCISLLCTNNI